MAEWSRNCDTCGRAYSARRTSSRFCGDTCRKRHARGAARSPIADDALVRATKRELEAAGKLDTRLGQQALVLAARMSAVDTAAGIGVLSKELDRVIAAAIGAVSAPVPVSGSSADVVDELRARRDAKRKV